MANHPKTASFRGSQGHRKVNFWGQSRISAIFLSKTFQNRHFSGLFGVISGGLQGIGGVGKQAESPVTTRITGLSRLS
jgi:hypothetical protein